VELYLHSSTRLHSVVLTEAQGQLYVYSHVLLGLPSGLFTSCSLTKILCPFLIAIMLATCPAYLNLIDLITLVIFSDEYDLYEGVSKSFRTVITK